MCKKKIYFCFCIKKMQHVCFKKIEIKLWKFCDLNLSVKYKFVSAVLNEECFPESKNIRTNHYFIFDIAQFLGCFALPAICHSNLLHYLFHISVVLLFFKNRHRKRFPDFVWNLSNAPGLLKVL